MEIPFEDVEGEGELCPECGSDLDHEGFCWECGEYV